MRASLRRLLPLGFMLLAFLFLWSSADPTAHAAGIKSDEQVIFYPALARQRAGGWEVQVHGLIYEPEQRRVLSEWLRCLLGLDEEDLTAAERALFRERMGYFLVDNERDKEIRVRVGPHVFRLGRSAAGGHFSGRWRWRTNESVLASWVGGASNGLIRLELPLEHANNRREFMDVHLLGDRGLSVISDIDDTIKISQVRDRDALLRNTFCRPFQPVPGLAARYRQWEQNSAVQFHYVTASPWQLYVPLSQFVRSNNFPQGTFHMKEFRVKDRSAFSLLSSPERYKGSVLEPLLEQFPLRSFVLVGDSGEKDPEIYGEVARRHPQQVLKIFIRNVTAEDENAPRYRAAFREVSRSKWQIFREPTELPERLLP